MGDGADFIDGVAEQREDQAMIRELTINPKIENKLRKKFRKKVRLVKKHREVNIDDWIDVSDRLPDDEIWCKVKVNNKELGYPVKFWMNGDKHYFVNIGFVKEEHVTHWKRAKSK